tara:strand:+ start:2972 stop:3556 length:585 start_codon:yes stop_codon:yes gene_type:complete
MSNSHFDKKKRSTPRKKDNLYGDMLINKVVPLPMQNVGSNLLSNIKTYIENEIEGKCIKEGYIKPDSIKIINYSNGVLQDNYIIFQVVIECKVCYPVEGQILNCFTKNITKAGIKAEIRDDENNPLVIFVARDHNYLSKNFSNIKENENLEVRVIGQRFELNDTQISVIGTLVEGKSSKSKLKIKEDVEINIDN